MFLKRIASSFSRSHHNLIIPYFNKGFLNPFEDKAAATIVQNELKIQDPYGFIYAFNNLIASINHEDFLEFANQTCDSELVKGFESGLKQLKENNQFIEPIYDPEIEEEIVFSNISFCLELNNDQSYYLQKPIFQYQNNFEIHNSLLSLFRNPVNTPKISVIVSCAIKCKTSIKIQNFQFHPYSYHFVRFLSIKKNQTNIFEALKSKDFSQLLLGKDCNWRIINIDEFLTR